jgi:hypothetical protein
MAEPKSGVAYQLFVVLDSRAETGFQVNPTIAAGDFQVSTDGGAFSNLDTLPVVTPAGSRTVQVDLSAAEMTGDKVTVLGVDAAGDEWSDIFVFIDAPEDTTDDIVDYLFNNATTVVEAGGTRLITVFEDDGSTIKAQARISKDGNTRTKL